MGASHSLNMCSCLLCHSHPLLLVFDNLVEIFILFPLHPSDDSGKCLLTSPSAVRAGSPRANSSSTTNQRQLRRIWTPYYGGTGG